MLKRFTALSSSLVHQRVDGTVIGQKKCRMGVSPALRVRAQTDNTHASRPRSLMTLLASGLALLAWESWRGWVLHLGPPGHRWDAHSAKSLADLLKQVDDLERQQPGLLEHVARAACAAAKEGGP